MPRIAAVTARQILDSRGIPTVEVTVDLDNGVSATSSAPSGAIANKVEALELRDHNSAEYFGMGVSKAVTNVNTTINERLVGQDPLYQTQIDQMLVDLDGTVNKSKIGANAILATSQAVIKAAAASLKLPLFIYVKEKYQLIQAYRIPTPIFNLMNGGRHGSGTLDFQEFQLVPASHLAYNRALRIGVEMFMALDKVLEQKGAIRTVGVEGGYSPNLATNTDALEIFSEAMKLTSYTLAQDAFLGLDVAPKWFFKSGKYTLKDRPQPMTGKQLVKFYQDMHHQYRVFAFEDPLVADGWADWKFMTAEMGETAMIVADDLITTNKTLLMKAIQEQACNAVVIKPNRIGTITEAIEIISLAKQAGWHTIMSHRSGETTDDILADIAVGVGTDYVKFGAPSRGERVTKYNRLLRIEEILLRSKEQNAGENRMADQAVTASAAPAAPSYAPVVPAAPAALPSWSKVSETPSAPAPMPTTPISTPPSTPAPVLQATPVEFPVNPPASTPSPAATPVLETPSPAGITSPSPAPVPTPVELAPTPVAQILEATSPAPIQPSPQVQPLGEVTATSIAPTDTSVSVTPVAASPLPVAPQTSVVPSVTPVPTLDLPSPLTAVANEPTVPGGTVADTDISQLQSSLDALASMAAPVEPTAPASLPDLTPVPPVSSASVAPNVPSIGLQSPPLTGGPAPASQHNVTPGMETLPLSGGPTVSATPQPGPAGLIPPTPPTFS